MIEQTKRVNYFNGQFLRAQDFQDEQKYHLDHRWEHNKAFYSAGVAEGLAVTLTPGTTDQVNVEAGWALNENGREMVLPATQTLEISGTPGTSVNIYVYPDPEVLSDPSTDPSTDPSVTRFTRIDEKALLIRVPTDAPASPDHSLLLATVTVNIGDDGTLTLEDKRTWAGIKTEHIQDDAVTSAKIAEADGTSAQDTNTGTGIKTGHIQDNAVTAAKLSSDSTDDTLRAVGTDHIQSDAVTREKLDPDLRSFIEGGRIGDDAIQSAMIAEADSRTNQSTNEGTGIKTGHIQDGAITTDKIQDDAVTADKLQSDPTTSGNRAVGKSHIQNGSVAINQLASRLTFSGNTSILGGGTSTITFETKKKEDHAFYLISICWVSPEPGQGQTYFCHWQRRVVVTKTFGLFPVVSYGQQVFIENPNSRGITVSCKVYCINEI
jgi:hypothetical protein